MVFTEKSSGPSRQSTPDLKMPKSSPGALLSSSVAVQYAVKQSDPKTHFIYITVNDSQSGNIGASIISIKDIQSSNPKDKNNKNAPKSLISIHNPETGETISRLRVTLSAAQLKDPSKLPANILSKALSDAAGRGGVTLPTNARALLKKDTKIEGAVTSNSPIEGGVDSAGNLKVLIPDSQKKIHLETIKVLPSGKVYRYVSETQLEPIGQLSNTRLPKIDGKTSVAYLSPVDRDDLKNVITRHFSKSKQGAAASSPTKPVEPNPEIPAPSRPVEPVMPPQQNVNPVDAAVQSYLSKLASPEESRSAQAAISTVRGAAQFQAFSTDQQLKFLDIFLKSPANIRGQLTSIVTSPTYRAGALLAQDINGNTVLDHVYKLSNHSPASMNIATCLLSDVTTPTTAIRQGHTPTCAATAIQFLVASYKPGEYARMVSSLKTEGFVALPSGDVLRTPGNPQLYNNTHSLVTNTFEQNGKYNRQGISLNGLEMDRILESLSMSGYRQLRASSIGSSRVADGVQRAVAGGKYSVLSAISMSARNLTELQQSPPGAVVNFSVPFGPRALHAIVVTDIGPQGVTFYNPWGKEQKMTHQAFLTLVSEAIVPDNTAMGFNR